MCFSHEFPAPVALDVPMEIVMLGTFGWEEVEYSHWEKMNNNTVSSRGLRAFSCSLLKELCWPCSCWVADADEVGQGPPVPS